MQWNALEGLSTSAIRPKKEVAYIAHPNVAGWRLLERGLDDLYPHPCWLGPAWADLHPAHANLCATATYAPTYVPRYMPTYALRYALTYFWAALNIAIPMHKGGSNKTIQANKKWCKEP